MELIDHKSHSKNQFEIQFIQSNFKIRNCVKYSEKERGSDEGLCNYYGRIHFPGCDDLCKNHKFLRFDVIGDSNEIDQLLPIVKAANHLVDTYWLDSEPKFVISVIGGFKRMNITNKQKKNFKQGLIDVMKKEKTLIIAGGFNVGIHKLVGETIREFRIHHEKNKNQVNLLGICTWGVVWNNDLLKPTEGPLDSNISEYSSGVSQEKSKVALDPNYDYFLFCDDGTEKKYDIEVDFRLELEKLRAKQDFAVQILFEGGVRAVKMAYETLKSQIAIVVLKGSGRAADMISDVMKLDILSFEKSIKIILEEYQISVAYKTADLPDLERILKEMLKTYRDKIIIYDMFDNNMKFGEMIVEAIISGGQKKSPKDMLKLTIDYNCPEIARNMVFLHPDYSKIDMEHIKKLFIYTLKLNKFHFITLFLENDFDLSSVVTADNLYQLYEDSREVVDYPCTELLNDRFGERRTKKSLSSYGKIISKLSGNIIQNIYEVEGKRQDSEPFGAQDLFLWSLLSGHIELAEIFWKYGKCHLSSALIGSTILANMAYYILKQGDSELQSKLIEASRKFEKLAIDILTVSYNENKEKTSIILIRQLKVWNDTTCFRIAISGKLLAFLSQSACRSYTTEIWMGDLSPFLPLWKILMAIPFSFCCMHALVLPSFSQKRSEKITENKFTRGTSITLNPNAMEEQHTENHVTFCKAMKIFYKAPIVKFYINFACYLGFLLIFAYLNLVELRPRNEIKQFRDMAAEAFVYIYLTAFIIEEIRQICEQDRSSIAHKLQLYFSGSCNRLDALIIGFFIICVILRFIFLENLFMIARCLFGICFCMFCIRTMQFYFAYEFVGPKVIMIRKMIRDISFFLSIFILFIISYGTLSHSIRFPNSPANIYLLKDLMQMPYFQTYGELMLDKLFDDGVCNDTNCHFQKGTIIIGFGLFLLLTNILLVNLLIAMFGYTFNQIQEESSKHWLFVRLQLVEEFYTKPILPPPFTVFYYLYVIWVKLVKHKPSDKKLLLRILQGDENLRITGYEQICMETSLEEIFTRATNEEVKAKLNLQRDKTDFDESVQAQNETVYQSISQSLSAISAYQSKCDKRFERLEKNLERLIANEN